MYSMYFCDKDGNKCVSHVYVPRLLAVSSIIFNTLVAIIPHSHECSDCVITDLLLLILDVSLLGGNFHHSIFILPLFDSTLFGCGCCCCCFFSCFRVVSIAYAHGATESAYIWHHSQFVHDDIVIGIMIIVAYKVTYVCNLLTFKIKLKFYA